MTTITADLADLTSWTDKGYSDIVLFGRFQPFHKGHMALLETIRQSGLRVHLVFNNKVDGAEGGERNPFNAQQRMTMARLALPWLENMRDAQVYLGGGGDVGNDVRRLTEIFDDLTPQGGRLVFAYFEKAEDRKQYLVDGQTITDAHYVELVGAPRGKFPIQRVTEQMIRAVTGDHTPIDAKMFRAGVKARDEICYGLLHPDVADFVRQQYTLAEAQGVPVGMVNARGPQAVAV